MEETKQNTQGPAAPQIFTIHMLPWENAPAEEPLLARLLREHSESPRKRKGREKGFENGMRVTVSYRLRQGDFFMEKKSGSLVLARSEHESYGWSLTKWDFSGRVTEKIRFSPELQWLQTAYFRDGNGKEPVLFLLPAEKGLELLERTEEGWRKSFLELMPAEIGARASLLKSQAGEPVCSIWSDQGLFWAFRPEDIRRCRETEEKLEKGELSEEPQWPGQSEASLPEERLPELERFLAESGDLPSQEEGQALSAVADDYAADHSLQDFADPVQVENTVSEMEPATKYAVAARSLSGVVSAPGLPQKREEEKHSEPEEKGSEADDMGSKVSSAERESGGIEGGQRLDAPSEEQAGISSEKNLPEALEKESDGDVQPEPKEAKPSSSCGEPSEGAPKKEEDFLPPGMEEFREFFRQLPDKLVTGSDGQIYAYYGNMKGSLRHGEGRTAMAGGHTAYEGGFREDKKDGFGVYYYKSGRLCYAGNWKGNRRQGAGVSFSPREGTMFAGSWRENRPEGMGALFDEDVGLLYAGQWKNGKRHGKGTEYRYGEVVFSGLWENGEPVVDGIGGGR